MTWGNTFSTWRDNSTSAIPKQFWKRRNWARRPLSPTSRLPLFTGARWNEELGKQTRAPPVSKDATETTDTIGAFSTFRASFPLVYWRCLELSPPFVGHTHTQTHTKIPLCVFITCVALPHCYCFLPATVRGWCHLQPGAQPVVRRRCPWIMMCWITTNLVMDVLMPLGGASVDGWSFIRFHRAVPSPNDPLQLPSVRMCTPFLKTRAEAGRTFVTRVSDWNVKYVKYVQTVKTWKLEALRCRG